MVIHQCQMNKTLQPNCLPHTKNRPPKQLLPGKNSSSRALCLSQKPARMCLKPAGERTPEAWAVKAMATERRKQCSTRAKYAGMGTSLS